MKNEIKNCATNDKLLNDLRIYNRYRYLIYIKNDYTSDEHFMLYAIVGGWNEDYRIQLDRLLHSRYQKYSRWSRRINTILTNDSNHHIFLTLTFTDDFLNSTTLETRRRYVSRFLNQFTTDYIANIDFGFHYKREHYHAVVSCNELIDNKTWVYGTINFKKIHTPNSKVLSNYLYKLTLHALKTDKFIILTKRKKK